MVGNGQWLLEMLSHPWLGHSRAQRVTVHNQIPDLFLCLKHSSLRLMLLRHDRAVHHLLEHSGNVLGSLWVLKELAHHHTVIDLRGGREALHLVLRGSDWRKRHRDCRLGCGATIDLLSDFLCRFNHLLVDADLVVSTCGGSLLRGLFGHAASHLLALRALGCCVLHFGFLTHGHLLDGSSLVELLLLSVHGICLALLANHLHLAELWSLLGWLRLGDDSLLTDLLVDLASLLLVIGTEDWG